MPNDTKANIIKDKKNNELDELSKQAEQIPSKIISLSKTLADSSTEIIYGTMSGSIGMGIGSIINSMLSVSIPAISPVLCLVFLCGGLLYSRSKNYNKIESTKKELDTLSKILESKNLPEQTRINTEIAANILSKQLIQELDVKNSNEIFSEEHFIHYNVPKIPQMLKASDISTKIASSRYIK
jgi:hypothetical protein